MLMPMVATTKVTEPSTTTSGLSTRSTIWTGSKIASPNTCTVPAVTTTMTTAKTMKLSGRPSRLPSFIARSSRAKREKSPKLSRRAAKQATISMAALAIVASGQPPPASAGGPSWSDRLDRLVRARIQPARANITTWTAGPQKSMNLRMVSMPFRKIRSWNSHMNRKHGQPSADRPRKPPPWASAAAPGARVMTRTCTALEAKQVCTPCQTMPATPRATAARLAPITPDDRRRRPGTGSRARARGARSGSSGSRPRRCRPPSRPGPASR